MFPRSIWREVTGAGSVWPGEEYLTAAFSTQWDIMEEKEPASSQRCSVKEHQASCCEGNSHQIAQPCSWGPEVQSDLHTFSFQNLAGQVPEQSDQTLILYCFEQLVELQISRVIPKLFSGSSPLPDPQCAWGQASQKWEVSCCALWLAGKLLPCRNRSTSRV